MKRALTLCFAVAVLALTPEPLHAKPDYLKRYQAGLQAIERQDWDRAAELMQKSLMERAKEARRLRQWFYSEPYLPHYYYGVAQFHSGNCGQALRSFNSSEEQGVLLGLDELYDSMLDLRERCRAEGAKVAEAGPGDDTEKKVRIADLARSADKVTAAAAPLAKSEKDKERFADTRTGLKVVETADEEVEKISDMADGSAPAALDRAVAAFFAGRPSQALATLEALDDENPKVMAHIYLLRAAAAHRLFLLSAEQDANLGERAREHARSFNRKGAGVSPPESLFGPRFLSFLASCGT
ncbi:MAG: hypothetical protein AAF725_22660 [Acidobacteriota bacterium]